jgi:pilus assembly protein CpaC
MRFTIVRFVAMLLIFTNASSAISAPKARGGYSPPATSIALVERCAAHSDIQLYVGESRVVSTPDLARIAVGSPKVMTAQVLDDDSGKSIIVSGSGRGDTSLHIWNTDGQQQCFKVVVHASDAARYAKEIAAFLAGMPRTKVSIVGDHVIVEGDNLSDANRDKIAELAKRYPQIVNFTSAIGWEKMIMMEVKVVEFPKTALKELGLKWNSRGGGAIGAIWSPGGRGDKDNFQIDPGAQGAPIVSPNPTVARPPSSLTVVSALNLGLAAQLNLLEQQGSAVMLAEPHLSTRSGFKASFLAGGELPYSVANVNGVSVMFKPYGIKLEIEPRVGNGGVIRAVIDTEVSSIDPSVTTPTGPGLLSRRARTEFNVIEGETIVLSGLLQRGVSTDVEKVPLLGDIPVIGALFRSKRFQNKETELVIFVTPRIVDSNSQADRIERAKQRLGGELSPAEPRSGAPVTK